MEETSNVAKQHEDIAEKLIAQFAGKGFVRRMISAKFDARAFENVDKELAAELADVAAAVGRETLDLQRAIDLDVSKGGRLKKVDA